MATPRQVLEYDVSAQLDHSRTRRPSGRLAKAGGLDGQAAHTECRVIQDIQELGLNREVKFLSNRNALIYGKIDVVPSRTIEKWPIAKCSWVRFRAQGIRTGDPVARDIRRWIYGINPWTPSLVYSDALLKLIHGETIV